MTKNWNGFICRKADYDLENKGSLSDSTKEIGLEALKSCHIHVSEKWLQDHLIKIANKYFEGVEIARTGRNSNDVSIASADKLKNRLHLGTVVYYSVQKIYIVLLYKETKIEVLKYFDFTDVVQLVISNHERIM